MDIAICEDNSTDCEIITSLLSMYFSDKSMTYKLELYENGTNLIYDFEEGRNFDIVFLDSCIVELNLFIFDQFVDNRK